jgi:predicted nucleic acid-binding protein
MTVVSNTTPLIALAEIGRLDLLRLLFGNLVIPPAVQREVQNPVARAALEQAADWITVQIPKDILAVRLLDETLDRARVRQSCWRNSCKQPG